MIWLTYSVSSSCLARFSLSHRWRKTEKNCHTIEEKCMCVRTYTNQHMHTSDSLYCKCTTWYRWLFFCFIGSLSRYVHKVAWLFSLLYRYSYCNINSLTSLTLKDLHQNAWNMCRCFSFVCRWMEKFSHFFFK